MTISSSNIKLSDIQTEFGGSNPISLSEYYSVSASSIGGSIPSSGTISTSNFGGSHVAKGLWGNGNNGAQNNLISGSHNNLFQMQIESNQIDIDAKNKQTDERVSNGQLDVNYQKKLDSVFN
jgi:hypothetical protein